MGSVTITDQELLWRERNPLRPSARYRITSGHPIYPHHVEDAYDSYEPVVWFADFDQALEWVKAHT